MLDDIASLTLQTAVSGLSLRQQATANNIANVETPGYTAQRVDFEASLAAALHSGTPTATSISTVPSSAAPGINGNNVSLSDELVTATQTNLQEKLLYGGLTSEYGLISTVLKG